MTRRSPIDPDRYAGTIVSVTASQVHANLPRAAGGADERNLCRGAVGDFVFLDCGTQKLLGRIIEVKIPDGERLSVEPKLGAAGLPHPLGRIQLLASVDYLTGRLQRGLKAYPRIGDAIYSAEPSLLAELIDRAIAGPEELCLTIGTMSTVDGVAIKLPPEVLFGRHCGIFGATGGGKSWTIANLIQQLQSLDGKAIVLDPTGEFTSLANVAKKLTFGPSIGALQQVHFPYRNMTEDDMFSLFRPSGQSQGPKLRDAIKSLKLVKALNGAVVQHLNTDGHTITKAMASRAAFNNAVSQHAAAVHAPNCDFDVQYLPEQIKNECVWATGQGQPGMFGGVENNALAYCESLIGRIRTLIHSPELECLFGNKGHSLSHELQSFLADENQDVALISFKDVRFEHNTRELLLNVIGRYLLGLAREGVFREKPVVVFLDEAHQFLGRTVGDDYASVRLDAFGLIAKEGRKYGLTCVLATQRPRDIPQDVISQLGTLIVHRLTNQHDRESVEAACGDLDRSAAQFVPMLSPGEAILIGPDLPVSVPLKVNAPTSQPDSRGPTYQRYWTCRKNPAANEAAG